MRCSCGHTFAPTAVTYAGTQVWPFAVQILHNCPRVKADGDVCGSTRAVTIWEDYEDTEQQPIAAE